MLEVLGPIGAIKVSSGTLEYGNVGLTDCVFLRFNGDNKATACVIYNSQELSSLLAILGFAEKLSQSSQPGTIIRLGALRPKPIILRVALIHPNSGGPFALLRMVSGRGKLDIPLPIAAALDLFRKGEVPSTSPPVCGMLRRDSAGLWLVGGKELHIPSGGLCAGVGHFGEYLHPDEVREGDEVVVWTIDNRGQEQVAAFRTLQQWQPPGLVNEAMAQEGDVALFGGETFRCRQIHKTFTQSLTSADAINPTWAAKIALSSLLCDIADGEDETAHATWIGNSPDPVLQVGINAIEQGHTSLHDQSLYQQVCCYLHALGPDPEAAGQSVNAIMEPLFVHLSENEPQQRRLLLDNWAVLLKEIFGGPPPGDAAEPWKRCKARYPGRVVPKVLCFPPPYPWVTDWSEQAPVASPSFSEAQDASPSVEAEAIDTAPPEEKASEPASGPSLEETPPLAEPAKKKGGPPKALILVAFVALCVVGFAAYKATSGQPSDSPTAADASTPNVAATPVTSPIAVASTTPAASPLTASPSPLLVASSGTPMPGPTAAATTPLLPAADLKLGKLAIGGLEEGGRYYVDRDIEGMKMLEQGPGWARYDKNGDQIFLGAKQSGTIKSTKAKAYAAQTLFSDGKKVLEAGIPMDKISPATLNTIRESGISVISSPDTHLLLGFSTGEFPESTLALGQPLGAELLTALGDRDLATFSQALTKDTANLVYMDGETLFDKVAKQGGTADYCKALLEAGADVNGEVGTRALFITADPAIADLLLKAGVPADSPGPDGQTKLFGAPPEMTKVLLAAKANPNFPDPAGVTPLAKATDPETVSALIKAGAKPNTADKQGKTALMGADLEMTKALLASGANPTLKDKAGKTAIDYAEGDPAIIALLKKPTKAAK